MQFLTLFILYLEFSLNSTNLLDKSHCNKSKFVSKINQFCIQTNPEGCKNAKNTCSDILGLWKSSKILEPVISTFEEDLNILLQQLNNYYYKTVPKLKNVKDNKKKKINFIYSIKIDSDYVETICTYMPSCMNFIYLIYGNRPVLSSLYKNHIMLCKTLPNFLAAKCTQDGNKRGQYNCENEMVYSLHKNFSLKETQAIYMKKDYQKSSQKFISSIYTLIENIDISPLIKKTPNLYENVFNDVPEYYLIFVNKSSYQGNELVKNEKYDNLIQKMKTINENYFREIKNKCDSSIIIPNDKAYITTRILLSYTFKRLEKHFKFNVLTPKHRIFDDKKKLVVYENDIQTLMSETFGELCNFLPLILYYTNKNEEIDTTLFSMYFTFCGNYTNVFSTQCPNLNKDIMNVYYEKSCVINAIKNKIQINFLSITGEVSKKDKYVNESTCTESNFEYVKKIYGILSEYFKGTFIPLWTTYDWMSGKNLLINNYQSAGMKNLKLETIKMENMSITLPNIFTNILPWNSNKKTLSTFQSIILYKIQIQLKNFLYRTAQIISLYVEHIDFNFDDKSLKPLRRSVDWYEYAYNLFYKNMCFQDKSIVDIGDGILISKIQDLNSMSCVHKIDIAVPNVIKSELKESSDSEINSTNRDSYIEKLRKKAHNNCNDALDFLNDLISILIKSNLIQKNENIESLKLYKTNCANIIKN